MSCSRARRSIRMYSTIRPPHGPTLALSGGSWTLPLLSIKPCLPRVAMAKGTPAQRAMAQDAVNRWWYPTLMMSGPPDKMSEHTARAMRWRIKTKTNDKVRQEFVDHIVPQIRALGLNVPDPDCKFDEKSGHYRFTAPDWDELRRVVNGDGPMNKERLAARRKAHEDGL